jgi:hypothetical protein
MEPERYLGESGTLLNGAGPSGLWPGSPYTRFGFVSSGVRVRSVHRLRSGPLGLCPVVSRQTSSDRRGLPSNRAIMDSRCLSPSGLFMLYC